MDPIIVLPAKQVEELISRYELATARLIEAEKELEALKQDQYVNYDWVCAFFGISKATAMVMLENEKHFVYGQQIKRFKRSALIKFAEKNSIKVCEVKPIAHKPHLLSKRS